MNFPSSPTVGTKLDLANGLIWTWNGDAWDLNTNYGQSGSAWVPIVNYIELEVGPLPALDTLFSENPEAGKVITYV